ncbi:MAG: hypothetical protein CBB71_08610 [Rhodopirellula sp. TMED11]|nr:MAG: hypothetical protein CBB71_08610 [Rhodopirellula sp. TMED11]
MGQNEHFVHPISLLQPGFQVPNTAQRAGGHGGFRCRVVNIKSLAMLVAADGIDGEIFDRSLDTNHSKQTVTEPIWQQPHRHGKPALLCDFFHKARRTTSPRSGLVLHQPKTFRGHRELLTTIRREILHSRPKLATAGGRLRQILSNHSRLGKTDPL